LGLIFGASDLAGPAVPLQAFGFQAFGFVRVPMESQFARAGRALSFSGQLRGLFVARQLLPHAGLAVADVVRDNAVQMLTNPAHVAADPPRGEDERDGDGEPKESDEGGAGGVQKSLAFIRK
jgi:hypothetical protein